MRQSHRRFCLLAGAAMLLPAGVLMADDEGLSETPAPELQTDDNGGPGHGPDGISDRRPHGRPGPGGPAGGPGFRPPMLIRILDTDGDGVISAAEIDGAASALKALDRNEDGRLTMDELRPPRPDGAAGFDRRSGRFGGEGPPGGRRHGRKHRGGKKRDGKGASAEQFLERIMQFDDDGDGSLSMDEAPERLLRVFDRLDSDGDERLSKEELKEAAERRMRRGRGEYRGKGPGRQKEKAEGGPEDPDSV